jgi:hypothetical protein
MNTRNTNRSHSFIAGVAALAITTVLMSALVESFDPVQLLRTEAASAPAPIAAVDARREASLRKA